ncbi:MAG: carboxypeptidase-like regulatory domain-containing protein [Saprospiraceae bacterium]|nr:carboxypeptidase-like regulatory domain-containing protein [Saprospiraceae bacterium]
MISAFSAGLGPIGKALGWMLIHSFWQISLVALVLALVLRIIPRKQVNARYALLLIGLVSVVVWSGITFQSNWAYYAYQPTIEQGTAVVQDVSSIEATTFEPAATAWQQGFQQSITWLDSQLNRVTFIWGIGVVLSCLYFIMGLSYLHYLQTHRVKMPELEWAERFTRLCIQMGIRRKVRFLLSEVVKDPITFRLLRPVILLPTSLMTGLEPKQIELLLLHELAHIRRYDFTVNILQTLVEIVFFYHPALWWISRNIRTTREHCCDDAVLAVQNQPILYAQALTRIPTSNLSLKKRLAMSAHNNKGILSQRIFRLFGRYESQPPIYRSILMAFLLLFLSLGSQAFLVAEEPVPESQEVSLVGEDPSLELQPEELVLEPLTQLDNTVVAEETAQASSERPTAEAPASIVEGTVVDENDQALIGVSILVKNTTVGTITDFDGHFKLKLPTNCATLVFSYVGRDSKEIEQSCAGQRLDVIMPATVELGEVVVIGKQQEPESTTGEPKAEEVIISGTVKDENDQPLIGTSILIKDTKIGTITDLTGNYRLSLPSECATLIFSYIGKQIEEVSNACGGQKLDIIMKSESTTPATEEKRTTKKELETVEGYVIDEAGNPLIGANILIKGRTIGTITDLKGFFKLELPGDCATLICSYVGKQAREVSEACKGQKIGIQLASKDATEATKSESATEVAKAEKVIISGTVRDENNQPLIGTSILIKGTKIGTITDLEGNYRLSLPSECATLIFSYIGKQTQEVTNTCGTQRLDVILKEKEAGQAQKPAAEPTQKIGLPEVEITTPETKILQDLTLFPNPSSGNITVSFKLEKATKVTIGIYTVDGKLLTLNVLGLGAGTHRHVWQDDETRKGTFLLQIQAEGEKISKQFILE